MKRSTVMSITMSSALAAALLTGYSVASAQSGVNDGGGDSRGVRSTTAGMPPTAQTLFAVVNADGTLARAFPRSPAAFATSSIKLATGNYQVLFYEDLTGCSYHATIGNAGTGTAPHGHITTAARAGQPKGVFIATADTAGTAADRQFHLVVTC